MDDLRRAEGRVERLAESVVEGGYLAIVLDRLAQQACDLVDGDSSCLTVRDRSAPATVIAAAACGHYEEKVGDRLVMDRCRGDRGPRVTVSIRRKGSVCAAPPTGPSEPRSFSAHESRVLSELAALADAALESPGERTNLLDDVRARLLRLVEALDASDSCTATHSRSVGELSRALGERLGLGAADLLELELAALFHDLGKIVIPRDILTKPGPLGPHELAIMRRHPEWGATLLATVPGLQAVATIVRFHHERWDGGGYPSGLSAERIPVASRIVAICDAYDAMVSGRPYRRALTEEAAVEELCAGAGSQFDPALVDLLQDELERDRQRTERELWLAADAAELAHAREFTDALASAFGFGADERFALTFAVNEVVENAIEHGTPSAEGRIHVRVTLEEGALAFYVRDFGRFTTDAATDEVLPERGRGLPLVARMVDELGVFVDPRGTVVRLAKRLPVDVPSVSPAAEEG